MNVFFIIFLFLHCILKTMQKRFVYENKTKINIIFSNILILLREVAFKLSKPSYFTSATKFKKSFHKEEKVKPARPIFPNNEYSYVCERDMEVFIWKSLYNTIRKRGIWKLLLEKKNRIFSINRLYSVKRPRPDVLSYLFVTLSIYLLTKYLIEKTRKEKKIIVYS